MSTATVHHPSVSEWTIPAERKLPPQGEWTYDDYCRLPEDGWIYEVIRGELYMSPAPQTRHQRCQGKIFVAFSIFVDKHDAGLTLDAHTMFFCPD